MPSSARAKVNLTVYEGTTFRQTFEWKSGDPAAPVDLGGMTGEMHVRKDIADDIPMLTLTTENGGIIIVEPPESGKYTLYVPFADTDGLCVDHEVISATYDLILKTQTDRMIQQYGSMKIYPSVTRIAP